MNKLETILGTVKGENESWQDVFARVDATGGIDIKTLTKVVIYLLEEQDGRNQTHAYGNQATYSGGAATIREAGYGRTYIEPTGFTTTDSSVQTGTGRIEEEIQPRIPSEDGTDPTVSGETKTDSMI